MALRAIALAPHKLIVMDKKRRFIVKEIVALLVIMGLVGCSSDEDILAQCTNVSVDMVKIINDGFPEEGYTLHTNTARAVKSSDFKKLYFIAAQVTGPRLPPPGHIGIWASNSLQAGEGMILSVNWLANDYSVWPNGEQSEAKISISDHGIRESETCAEVLSKKST